MLRELMSAKQQYINYFFDKVDLTKTQQVLDALQQCTGTIFFAGVGKSGLVAKKIAVTMAATGTRALHLSPVDALHGDLGIVTSQDLFVLLSKSGETEELLNLIPHIRNKGAGIIGVSSNPASRLSRVCDLNVYLPVEKELCPFDLAPTTSTAVQMIFGDVLAVALMKNKQFSLEEYALNHPSGRIGKRATLRVSDVMLRGDQLPLCKPQDKIVDVLVTLSEKRCGALLVVTDDGTLKGIFVDGDLRRSLQKMGAQALETRIDQLMTKNPKVIQPEALAWEALKLMEADPQRRITVLPVVDAHHRLQGLLHIHDIIQSGL